MNESSINIQIAERVFGMSNVGDGWLPGSLPEWAPWEDWSCPVVDLPNFCASPVMFFVLLAWCRQQGWDVTCSLNQDPFWNDEVIIEGPRPEERVAVFNSGEIRQVLCLAILKRLELDDE